MNDKKELKEAWMKGFVSARKNSFTSSTLDPTTQKTAEKNFERWWDMNKAPDKVDGMGCPTCGSGPDYINDQNGVMICSECGSIMLPE